MPPDIIKWYYDNFHIENTFLFLSLLIYYLPLQFVNQYYTMSITISVNNIVPRIPELRFNEPVFWEMKDNEQWAFVGPNGSGKTLFSDILQGKISLKEGNIRFSHNEKTSEIIKSIAFKDIHSFTDSRNTYYQQRWHSTETDDVPTIGEILKKYTTGKETDRFMHHFNIEEMLSKKIISLSSGELRKFLIYKTLMSNPKILILDNPFIGLDAASRIQLNNLLQEMASVQELQTILLLSDPSDIPDSVTHILPFFKKKRPVPVTREEFINNKAYIEQLFPSGKETISLPGSEDSISQHDVTFRMEKVNIKYGNRTILKNIDWEVKNGEKWALLGPNGAGKSTLLSLIYADNPQSYANTFYLFDRKRGSGESIWEIKKHIGYVSPEMHLYYTENVPSVEIVGSGFFDSIGLYRKCNPSQEITAIKWMHIFGIDHLAQRSFITLSSGEQRLVLLARAFVKNPDLLILDEPLHGLDISNKNRASRIIEQYCDQPGKTLVYVTHYPQEMPACVNHTFKLTKNV